MSKSRKQNISSENLYPYLVPASYLAHSDEPMLRPLGHAIYVTVVLDLDGLVQSVSSAELADLSLTVDQANARALENLERLFADRALQFAVFQGPQDKPFVVCSDHWEAAAAILLPRLKEMVSGKLGSEICVSIPHRDAMLIFPMGDRAYRDEMRALVKKNESDYPKPLTFELFTITDSGVEPFEEAR